MDASRIQVAVVGGGTMGRDIAATFANAGAQAHIVETFPQARALIAGRIGQTFDKLGSDAAARARYTVHESLAGVSWPSIDKASMRQLCSPQRCGNTRISPAVVMTAKPSSAARTMPSWSAASKGLPLL